MECVRMVNDDISAGTRQPVRFIQTTSVRLRTTREFRRCYEAGRPVGDRYLLLFAAVNDQPYPRFGVSVSKKHGNAARRNRKKRMLREAFRLAQHDLPGLDFVLVPRQTDDATLRDYITSLVRLATQLWTRIEPNQQTNA
ncbi:MAG: ribonuclease P protein component [Fuerstiella sp.]|nr:ribonuclease P protein component [Fuerstiella sp.]